jgi:hypothetical protein
MRKTILLLVLLSIALTASARRRSVSPDQCTVSLSQQTANVPAAGGRVTIAVGVSAGCTWVPTSAEGWLTASPSGNTVVIDVQQNAATAARIGVIHIRGAVIIINQAAANPIPNMITNGGFDTTIAGWSTSFSTGSGSALWAAPGVAQLTSTQPPRGYQIHQCVNVKPNQRYTMGVKAFIETTQPEGAVVFGVYEYRIPDCDVTRANPETRREEVRPTPRGEWFELTKTFTTVTNAQSLLIVVGAGGSNAPSFTARVDDVYLREQ